MKRTRNPRTLRKTLKRWLVLPVLILWFLSMALLTWAVAKDMYRQLEDGVWEWCRNAIQIDKYIKEESKPGLLEQNMFDQMVLIRYFLSLDPLLPIVLPQNDGRMSNDDPSWDNWELEEGYQAACAFYDEENRPVMQSGDYLFFSYRENALDQVVGYGYVDLEELPDGKAFADRYVMSDLSGDRTLLFYKSGIKKMTGWFEGDRFIPVEISIGTEKLYSGAPTDRELVTIFLDNFQGYNYEPGNPFYLNGKRYENAAALLEEDINSRFGLFSAVISMALESNLRAEIVVWCSPIKYAVCRLWPVYAVSIILVAVYLNFRLKKMHATITEPLGVINRAFEANRTELSDYAYSPYQDLQELGKHFVAAQQERHQSKNQVRQLETALNYARNAEENRRKMVSAIAHELKTPLAVIHSYAEGLQAGIAAQKQEKYLSVILEETESMDAMVLEMLDLSRLEAGKVQLSMDQFSLTALTQGIFEKLALAMEAKQLQIKYLVMQELFITADESRISQVITNLATNAVKYTPQGGLIRVRLFHSVGQVHFCIENTGPQLSQEALSQVWDTFYRADTARAGSGTGLGLAIVKNIVELHRGTCSVQNTNIGVEFRFQIPM